MVRRVKLRQRAKFRGDSSNRRRDMAIFRFFKMAAAAILDFSNFKFLTVGRPKRAELRRRAVFTARRHASAVYSAVLCLSDCLSQVGVLLKRLNVGSCKQRHTIAKGL